MWHFRAGITHLFTYTKVQVDTMREKGMLLGKVSGVSFGESLILMRRRTVSVNIDPTEHGMLFIRSGVLLPE